MHGIEGNDTAIYFKEPAWHGLGKVFEGDVMTSEVALREGGLDWKVVQKPICGEDGKPMNMGNYARVMNVVEGTNNCVGIVSPKYKVVQNRDAFSVIDELIAGGIGAQYESAGSLFGQRRVWVLCRLPESNILGDTTANYIFFDNSHDGTKQLRMGLTSVRVVCNNTLQLALSTAPRLWTMRHCGSIDEKKFEIANALMLTTKYLHERDTLAETMALTKINFEDFVAKLYPVKDNATERAKSMAESKRQLVTDIYNKRDDLGNFRGTAWGAYQAVSDAISNYKPLRLTKKYNETRMADFMDGNAELEKAQIILMAA